MLRWTVAALIAIVSAIYFGAAYTTYSANASFEAEPRSETIAKLEHLTEMSVAERGLALPLIEGPRYKATVSFSTRSFGTVIGTTKVPSSIVAGLKNNQPVHLEYALANPTWYRFRGASDTPALPLSIGMSLLVLAVTVGWRAVRPKID
ncbi:hypothetical protein [Lysobacter tyrosinilyticus]